MALNEYPWQAGIVSKWSSFVWCGGSLISSQWVLTAAHCTQDKQASGLQVLLGEHNYYTEAEAASIRINIMSIIDHPQYDEKTTDYDFSLLKLDKALKFSQHPDIRPICLPLVDEKKTYAGVTATVTGWGTTSSGGPTSPTLRGVDVNILSNSACQNNYGYPPAWITEQMLCANTPGGGKDACQGDSGGPLVSSGGGDGVSPGQNYELVGVVSWGIGCAGVNYPGVYARVTKQLQWVRAVTGDTWDTCNRL